MDQAWEIALDVCDWSFRSTGMWHMHIMRVSWQVYNGGHVCARDGWISILGFCIPQSIVCSKQCNHKLAFQIQSLHVTGSSVVNPQRKCTCYNTEGFIHLYNLVPRAFPLIQWVLCIITSFSAWEWGLAKQVLRVCVSFLHTGYKYTSLIRKLAGINGGLNLIHLRRKNNSLISRST